MKFQWSLLMGVFQAVGSTLALPFIEWLNSAAQKQLHRAGDDLEQLPLTVGPML